MLQEKTDEFTDFVGDAKEKYARCISNKFNDPLATPKNCWSIWNSFLSYRKLPAIPPLLVNADIITKFSEKADLFNKYC